VLGAGGETAGKKPLPNSFGTTTVIGDPSLGRRRRAKCDS